MAQRWQPPGAPSRVERIESGPGGKMETSCASACWYTMRKRRMVNDDNTGLTDQEIWY